MTTTTTTKTTEPVFDPDTIVFTKKHLREVVEAYKDFDEFVFDVETRGPYRGRPERAQVAWIGLAGPGRSDVIPMGHINGELITPMREERKQRKNLDGTVWRGPDGKRKMDLTIYPATFTEAPKQLWPGTVFDALEPLFYSNRRKIGHNVKFDLTAIAKYYDGEIPPQPYGDTLILMHLLNEQMNNYKLDHLVDVAYGMKYDDGKLGKLGIDYYPFSMVAKYQFLDVIYTWMLWSDYFPRIERQSLTEVFENIEMPLIETLCSMEAIGAPIDMAMLEDMRQRIDAKTEAIKHELHAIAGKPWNVHAANEKGWFVYKVRGHEVQVRTPKTGNPSTASDDLAKYAKKDPAVAKLAEYAELWKLKSTYIDGINDKIIEGRLHPSFLSHGTKTGRFSCASPNLQNIPRVTDEREEFQIRDMFCAPPGCTLIVADYSQIEYRLFAHFSQDPYMIKMFKSGVDAHSAMASLVTGKSPDELSPEERTNYGKVVNFAIGFGAGPGQVAMQAKVSLKKAKAILEAHEKASPSFYKWKRKEIELAKSRFRKGKVPAYVRTMSGRKRRLNTLFSTDYGEKMGAQRQAINTIVQGSAADIMKRAMIRVHDVLAGSDVTPILTVHDELVIICPKDKVNWATPLIREAMESAASLRVPLLVDIGVAERWSAAK